MRNVWKLTPRESACFRLMALGYSYNEIAQRMDIGADTVRNYGMIAMQKYGITRNHVLAMALHRGIVTTDEAIEHLPDRAKELCEFL